MVFFLGGGVYIYCVILPKYWLDSREIFLDPVDISGTVVGESPDCLLLSWTGVGENLDHVCWGGVSSFSFLLGSSQ